MWENMVQPDRPHSTCTLHATHTHLEYLILTAFSMATVVVNMCYLYMDIACLVFSGILKIQPAALSGNLMHNSVLIKIRKWSFRAPTKQAHRLKNQYQLDLRHANTISNVKYAHKPHIPSMVLSCREQRQNKEEKT